MGKSLFMSAQNTDRRQVPGPAGLLRVPSAGGVELIVCEYGNRLISRVFSNSTRVVLAADFQGAPLNGPSALALSNDGATLYFSDPVHALKDSSAVSSIYALPLNHNGVAAGPAILVDSSMSAASGIVLSSDNRMMFVSNADPKHAVIRSFVVNPEGLLHAAGTVFDLEKWYRKRGVVRPGGLTGLVSDSSGRLYAASSCGVLVLPPGGGDPLAFVDTGMPVKGVTISEDGYLYMTSAHSILRISIGSLIATLQYK